MFRCAPPPSVDWYDAVPPDHQGPLHIKAAQGFDDPQEPENWGAGLELVEEQILTRAPEVDRFPQPLHARTRLTAHSTALSRQGARILRYRF